VTLVTLTPDELYLAGVIGVRRRVVSIGNGAADRNHYDPAHAEWATDIEGAAAELAVAKVLDRYHAGLNYRAPTDVGGRLHVRHTVRDDGCLIVRDRDPDFDPFVLVVGFAPRYRIAGWLYGREAKRDEWRSVPTGGPAAYFVPQQALQPLPDRRP
jgi:hypothetical protein